MDIRMYFCRIVRDVELCNVDLIVKCEREFITIPTAVIENFGVKCTSSDIIVYFRNFFV